MQLPTETVYVQNLNHKTKKDEMKKALYLAFSAYGRVLDVVVCKTAKLRGQAWVVYENVPCSTNALRGLQGLPFYDRELRLSFARGTSDALAKQKGTWLPKDKRSVQKRMLEDRSRKAGGAAADRGGAAPSAGVSAGAGDAPEGQPNKTLFVQGLPENTTQASMQMLFQQFPGFADVRMVPQKPGIAFVDYETEAQATMALMGLNGFKITSTHSLGLSYAK